jgi:predicted metalloenzyme YecM
MVRASTAALQGVCGAVDPIADIIGDYRAFAAMQRDRLVARGIDIAPYPLSHLAVRVADWDLYVHQRTLLERHARANRENLWNGRPISLIVLAEPLEVLDGAPVSRIELIPPFTSASTGWVSSTSASSSVRRSTSSRECIEPR